MMIMKTKMMIFDSHQLYPDCLIDFISCNDFGKNYEFHSSIDFESLKMNIYETDILVMNIGGFNTTEATEYVEYLLVNQPKLKIILVSPNSDVKIIKKFFDKGIKAYLNKYADRNEFLLALKQVALNKVYINEDIKQTMFDFVCGMEDHEKKNKNFEEITDREKDILYLICQGLKSKEIADRLFISINTVETHRRNIMLKFNIRNSPMLVKFAILNNIVN